MRMFARSTPRVTFDRLLPMETQPPLRDTRDLPFLSRIGACADVEFSSPDVPAIEQEASSLLPLATLGPEVRGLQRLSALARYGANLPGRRSACGGRLTKP